jgi:hypothetical protein
MHFASELHPQLILIFAGAHMGMATRDRLDPDPLQAGAP